MKTFTQFLIECWLFESPIQDSNIDRTLIQNNIHRIIDTQKQHAKPIHGDMMHIDLPSGHKVVYHSHQNINRGVSIFKVSGNIAAHQVTHTMGGDVSDIYKNIQHMVDSGYEVHSHDAQSKGGRNLWMNIHNHVKHTELGVITSGVKKKTDSLLDHKNSDSADELFYIK